MRGGLSTLVIGIFIGAYLVLGNDSAAAWFGNFFTTIDNFFGSL